MSGQCPIGAATASRLHQANFLKLMVPDEGIEPPTFGLQNRFGQLPASDESAYILGDS
jgi:hypothetical protein